MIYAVCALALPVPLKVLERIGLTKKYSEWIKIAHPQPLDDKQGHAPNLHNHEAWLKLLEETITKYKIKVENTYATDEVGIQAQRGGEHEYVFGPHTKATPYQQHSRTCMNITTIVTIYADGTSTLPSVIFKGSRSNGGKMIPLMHCMSF